MSRFNWNPQLKEEFRALAAMLRFKNEGQLHEGIKYSGSEKPSLNDMFHDSVAEVFSRNRKGKSVTASILIKSGNNAKLLLAKNESFHASDEELRVIMERKLREVARRENRRLNNSRGRIITSNSITGDISTGNWALLEAIINHQNKLRVDTENLREQLKVSQQPVPESKNALGPYIDGLLESIPDDLSEKLPAVELIPMIHRAYEFSLKLQDK